MCKLKGITWDHPRGYEPLKAVSAMWQVETGIEVSWDVRTLKEFGDYPIEKLIAKYDFIVIDHPYMGEAAANGLLVAVDRYLDKSFMDLQKSETVGESFRSYEYDGHWWALPVDAAAQVSAYRKDIIDKIDWQLPADVMQLSEAAERLAPQFKISIPLCITDIWCVFLSLCCKYSKGDIFTDKGVDVVAGEWALTQIRSWKEFLHEAAFHMNPIQMLENMSVYDDIVYVPFTFGYTNYSRKGWPLKRINFCNVPKYKQERYSALLGGAGLAVSAHTEHLDECLQYLRYILKPDIQKGAYYQNGGQPAHIDAWLDAENNNDCFDFFKDTLETLSHAYVRPRIKGFNRFQEKAADHIHAAALNNVETYKAIHQLNELYQTTVNEKV